ncbi:MAG: AAA family ATPase [Candidatus Thiodiazotropha sp. (ex Epidulcina cf. delphinae)]|nr:AAA family ATPase [Candidatus Thiodiazotropha sp. (ex Epidulcina cf. delphinae)]
MKFSHFGFRENPFAITPDPRYLYLSRVHEESLAHLIYGTGPNGGFVLLTGEVGTGKTLLLRSLLAQHLDKVEIALILNPRLSRREFIAAVCDELGVGYHGPPYSLKLLIDTLTQHLLKTHAEGRHTVLVVDEAQNLNPRVLEQVRLLTNLETSRHKLLRIILVGQPEFQQMLERKELRQVDQRITARYHLSPLDPQETHRYIIHRLAVAGVREDLFTPTALRLVHRFTGGVPRRINTLCERALLAIYATGRQRVGVGLVWRAAREVKGRRNTRRRWLWAGMALLVGCGVLFWVLQATQAPDSVIAEEIVDERAMPAPVEQAVVEPPTRPPPLPEQVEPFRPPPEPPLPAPEPASKPTAEPLASAESPPQPVADGPPTGIGLERFFADPQNSLAVYQRLFGLWEESLKLKSSSSTPCLQAPEYGLRCLKGHAVWNELLRLNRPLMARLEQGGRERLLVLKHVDEEWLLVDTGEREGVLRLAQLKPYWTGGFVMLWRPSADVALIGEGSAGSAVTWLRQRLQLADGQAPPDMEGLDRFDKALERRLRKFQRLSGLEGDGIAGQQTQIHLNNLAIPKGTPTLVSDAARAGG